MKPKKTDNSQSELFRNRLRNQLNPKHEMFILSETFPWNIAESELDDLHSDSAFGQPPKPIRLMVGLLLLQHMHNLSDEGVVRAWVENPYWQFFCGYDFLQWDFPVDSSSLTRWRKRIGPELIKVCNAMT